MPTLAKTFVLEQNIGGSPVTLARREPEGLEIGEGEINPFV